MNCVDSFDMGGGKLLSDYSCSNNYNGLEFNCINEMMILSNILQDSCTSGQGDNGEASSVSDTMLSAPFEVDHSISSGSFSTSYSSPILDTTASVSDLEDMLLVNDPFQYCTIIRHDRNIIQHDGTTDRVHEPPCRIIYSEDHVNEPPYHIFSEEEKAYQYSYINCEDICNIRNPTYNHSYITRSTDQNHEQPQKGHIRQALPAVERLNTTAEFDPAAYCLECSTPSMEQVYGNNIVFGKGHDPASCSSKIADLFAYIHEDNTSHDIADELTRELEIRSQIGDAGSVKSVASKAETFQEVAKPTGGFQNGILSDNHTYIKGRNCDSIHAANCCSRNGIMNHDAKTTSNSISGLKRGVPFRIRAEKTDHDPTECNRLNFYEDNDHQSYRAAAMDKLHAGGAAAVKPEADDHFGMGGDHSYDRRRKMSRLMGGYPFMSQAENIDDQCRAAAAVRTLHAAGAAAEGGKAGHDLHERAGMECIRAGDDLRVEEMTARTKEDEDDARMDGDTCEDNKRRWREAMYAQAALQAVDWRDIVTSAAVSRPKRRHVRLSSHPQTTSARRRRERISLRIRVLQRLVPGGTHMDTASMLDEAIHYLKFLKAQLQALEHLAKSSPTSLATLPTSSRICSIPKDLNTIAFSQCSFGNALK